MLGISLSKSHLSRPDLCVSLSITTPGLACVRTEKGGERTRERKERGRGKELKEEGWAARSGKMENGMGSTKMSFAQMF